VVDTVGAGDASIAALVASRMLMPDGSPAAHLGYAVAAGTAACQSAGATPPTREATLALLQRIVVTEATG
jgi:fructokinase